MAIDILIDILNMKFISGHWDLALLVSALNFYAIDGSGRKVPFFFQTMKNICHQMITQKDKSNKPSYQRISNNNNNQNGVTMGLARVGGMCTKQHNCVIGNWS